jgi:hypothetical protein
VLQSAAFLEALLAREILALNQSRLLELLDVACDGRLTELERLADLVDIPATKGDEPEDRKPRLMSKRLANLNRLLRPRLPKLPLPLHIVIISVF